MPADTIYIPGITGPPPAIVDTLINGSGIDSTSAIQIVQKHLDSLGKWYLNNKLQDGPQYIMPEWEMFLVVLLIIGFLLFMSYVTPARSGKTETVNFYSSIKKPMISKESQYDEWLKKYNPYYNSLSESLQKIFLERTVTFMREKEFRFHAMVEEEYIPVLISGAAVQLTFGLRNYRMGYFPVIHVIRKEYTLDINRETYYGHVSRTGIYISWNHFLEGYADYNDSINVGLHEMAHAISYDAFLGYEDEHDRKFKERLNEFTEEGKPLFRAMRQGASHVLDDYACTNFDEFWAVCAETFFENPVEFSDKMPALYKEISELLNQDPLLPEKIIDPVIAGLGFS